MLRHPPKKNALRSTLNGSFIPELVIALDENNEASLSGGGDRDMVISTPIPRYIVTSGAPITP